MIKKCLLYVLILILTYSFFANKNYAATGTESQIKRQWYYDYAKKNRFGTSLSEPLTEEGIELRVQVYKQNYYNNMPYWQKYAYDTFFSFLEEGKDFKDVNSGWIKLREGNENLVIGCSTAVWCGYTIDGTELEKYGYDIIGLGGAFDTDITHILEKLGKKNYKKIIIFGGINDINLRAFSGVYAIDKDYAKEIGNLVDEARRHLKNGVTELVFIRVKEMEPEIDTDDYNYLLNFNNCALQYNDLLTYLIGVKYYDIPYDTSRKYSAGYVHYNNIDVYKKIFDDINEM